ncbi:hypothetical protein GHN41_16670 [Pseudomonas helleri]|uniref:Uncharacterized protein n=1 Tax=Pseudomonas helleri TaxID=1608996 RepID=A0A6G1W9C1_9PSED|nr:hypothetical protein [Pseudomonas helleri]MQT27648.1 hypothetical protein [Pseudomonas helleri]MQU18072.1 hypothetical protein [Pseudomonas helleri]
MTIAPENMRVNAGIIIASLPDVAIPLQRQADVVSSLLLAQLSARFKFPLASQYAERENAYESVLTDLSWTTLHQSYNEQQGAQTLDVVNVLMNESARLFEFRIGVAFSNMASNLQLSAPTDKARKVWREHVVRRVQPVKDSTPDCSAIEESVVCIKLALIDSDWLLHTLMLRFSTRAVLTEDFLNQSVLIAPDTSVDVQGDTYSLNESVYRHLRDTINDKLTHKRTNLVMPWSVSPSTALPVE